MGGKPPMACGGLWVTCNDALEIGLNRQIWTRICCRIRICLLRRAARTKIFLLPARNILKKNGDKMGKFIVKRLLISVVILFCVMLIIYTLMHCLPTNYIETIEKRQGLKVACLEGIALRKGWITTDKMRELAKPMLKNQYGQYLMKMADEFEKNGAGKIDEF
jgi:hypothetical protein